MERPGAAATATGRNISAREWESLIEDFQHGGPRRFKWSSQFTPLSVLVDLALSTLLKKDFPHPLKLHILAFLDEFSQPLFSSSSSGDQPPPLSRFVETLKLVVQSPVDGVSMTFALKEQMLVSATSVTVVVNDGGGGDGTAVRYVPEMEELVAVLLAIINRPNHGVDRQTRAVACECLRELEGNFPGLLGEIVGHLWALCQSERTHSSQSYLLLLLQVIGHVVVHKLGVSSIVNTSVALVPFNLPNWMFRISGGSGGDEDSLGMAVVTELSGSNLKELRRVMAFLFEWTQVLTPPGVAEFVSMAMPVVVALELQVSLLKVQFSGLIYTSDPLLCHVVLMLYLRFLEAFDGREGVVLRRLVEITKQRQNHLVFRLLALQWWLGFVGLVLDDADRKTHLASDVDMGAWFYPTVFDALALKSMKLDLLAFCTFCTDLRRGDKDSLSVNHFEDGLVSLSGFKWLPPWSTETALAFRAIHKFLIGRSSHSCRDSSTSKILTEPPIFGTIQSMLVNLMLDFQKLVPMAVALVERLLHCQKHLFLGENLLLTFDERLLSKVSISYKMISYFPVFDRICRTDTISPERLLELLSRLMVFLVEQHGPDNELKSWSQGSKVLSICRTMLMHHHSSRLFIPLSRLLAFTSLYFPDLEIRDNARIYLRMLACIPGKKLRQTLSLGEQQVGISPSTHAASFFNVLSPRHSQDPRKSKTISSYILLGRMVPLLVKQSWSLSLPPIAVETGKYSYFEGIKDNKDLNKGNDDDNDYDKVDLSTEAQRIEQPPEPLRVMDSKIADILGILRKHFSCIPDFRHMEGLKIKISCELRFKSGPFKSVWGVVDSSGNDSSKAYALPAMYATVLSFSSSAPYGSIPSYHVPFLFGEPPSSKDDIQRNSGSMEIVPVESGLTENKTLEHVRSKAAVIIELEPREPVPGLVNVLIDSNAENGQIIHGPLHDISVGIEDMFLRAIAPPEIADDLLPHYYMDLYNALWEACGSSCTGREVFSLKGGKGVAAIHGTRSVKLLEIPSAFVIRAVEQHLSSFVVSVIGEHLEGMVKDGGVITNVIWKDDLGDSCLNTNESISEHDDGPLCLTYFNDRDCDDDDGNGQDTVVVGKTYMGCFLVLIFLPPRYHLLFQMEVSDVSTLVRIRTDHWPCLAYIDDYLEALFYK